MTTHTIFDKISRIISADLRSSQHMDVEGNAADHFACLVHDISFLTCCALALLFYADVVFFGAFGSRLLIDVFSLGPAYLKYLTAEQIKLFYVACTPVMIPIALFGAIYFYIRAGHNLSRADVVWPGARNPALASIVRLIGGPIGCVIFFLAGYLVGISLFEATGLDRIPGAVLLQIIIAAKMQAYVAASLYGAVITLFPYNRVYKRPRW
jgi:hypothetical protein